MTIQPSVQSMPKGNPAGTPLSNRPVQCPPRPTRGALSLAGEYPRISRRDRGSQVLPCFQGNPAPVQQPFSERPVWRVLRMEQVQAFFQKFAGLCRRHPDSLLDALRRSGVLHDTNQRPLADASEGDPGGCPEIESGRRRYGSGHHPGLQVVSPLSQQWNSRYWGKILLLQWPYSPRSRGHLPFHADGSHRGRP